MSLARGRCLRAAVIAAVTAAMLTACSGEGESSAAPGDAVADGFPLRVVRDIPLPGNPSRLDYQDIDPIGRRLYIAHLGDGTVHVVDLGDLQVVATIDGIASAHGVRVAPDVHRLYASATGTNELVTIDTAANRVVGRAPTGRFPDGIAYDPEHAKVYVSDKDDHVETVIDAHTGERIGTIAPSAARRATRPMTPRPARSS